MFYKNRHLPTPSPGTVIEKRLMEGCNTHFSDKIPLGFSCGIGRSKMESHCEWDDYIPVDCSEVTMKITNSEECPCSDGNDDCRKMGCCGCCYTTNSGDCVDHSPNTT